MQTVTNFFKSLWVLDFEVIVKLKEYECVEVKHHSDVGRTIKEWQEKGWRLHTYQATGTIGMAMAFVNHYLLFEKGQ